MSNDNLFRMTGKASFVIELKKYGPMIIDVNDHKTLRAVLSVLFHDSEDEVDEIKVSAYPKKTGRRAKKLLKKE